MSKKKHNPVLQQYGFFLDDFGFNPKYLKKQQDIEKCEMIFTWGEVLNYPAQKEVIIHPQDNEHSDHFRGKKNMAELFIEYNETHNNRYLIWTERQQIHEQYIKAFGAPRTYRPDVLVFDKIGFSYKHPHYGIYIIEIDGRQNHTSEAEVFKDEVRDEFFFRFYNAVTVRIPTWHAHGRKRTFLEPQDLHDEMIYTANQLVNEQKRLGNR